MSQFQLLDCSSTLGTCCNDTSLTLVLNITQRVLHLIQIIVPILLIIASTIGFYQLLKNPEMKNGVKSIVNKYIAALIVFFLPVIMDAVLGVLPGSFSVSACWKQARSSAEITRANQYTYVSYDDGKKASKIFMDPSSYEKGKKKPTGNGSGGSNSSGGNVGSGTGQGSATGLAIVQYAKSFVGQRYVWGGTWNGELPYTGTDCSGFVRGVFKHFGINLTRTTYTQWADTGSYSLVNSGEIRAGDLVMYDGHVGILTGNGNEIVHAKGSKWGIVTDPDYRQCSSHAIKGIMRIHGVN